VLPFTLTLTAGASDDAWTTRRSAGGNSDAGGGGGTIKVSLLLLQAVSVINAIAAAEIETMFFIFVTLQLIVATKIYAGKKTQDQLCPSQKTEWFIEKNNLI